MKLIVEKIDGTAIETDAEEVMIYSRTNGSGSMFFTSKAGQLSMLERREIKGVLITLDETDQISESVIVEPVPASPTDTEF